MTKVTTEPSTAAQPDLAAVCARLDELSEKMERLAALPGQLNALNLTVSAVEAIFGEAFDRGAESVSPFAAAARAQQRRRAPRHLSAVR